MLPLGGTGPYPWRVTLVPFRVSQVNRKLTPWAIFVLFAEKLVTSGIVDAVNPEIATVSKCSTLTNAL